MQSARGLAAAIGTMGFAVSILAGLRADNSFVVVLEHALWALVLCFTVGYFVGLIVQCVAREQATAAAKIALQGQQKSAGAAGTPLASDGPNAA